MSPSARSASSHMWALERVLISAALAVPVLYALIVNFGALTLPPAWDSAITVSPAALTMLELDFDVWELAQLPSSPEGGPSTHATSLYTILLAGLIALLGPSNAFYTAHVLSILMIGGITIATYLLSRERASVLISALAAVTVGVIPLVVQQAADVYLDLPLAVVVTFACWSALRRRFWLTASLVLFGVAIKTSAIFLLPLLFVARPATRPFLKHLFHAGVASLAALVPFFVVIATTHRLSTNTTPSMNLPLVQSSIALLILTVDVFVILAIFGLVLYGHARSGKLDRLSQAGAVLLAGFFAVHFATILFSGTIAILPRYYVAVLPTIIAALLPVERPNLPGSRRRQVAIGFLLLLASFSVLNRSGDLYPRPNDDFYVVAERSTRAQELLKLQVWGTRRLVEADLPILAERQVHFRLLYPGMGYVRRTPDDVTSVFVDPVVRLPDRFVMLIERRYANPLLEIEEEARAQGYGLVYHDVVVGPFSSQVVIATRAG